MMPSETRNLLLQQHARLRELFGIAEAAADRLLAHTTGAAELHDALVELRRALAAHTAAEEAVLEPLLRTADAWGPLRVDRMLEEHEAEHAALNAALEGEDHIVARRIAELAETLDAHMLAEERTILNPTVLRDDLVEVESTS
jgi:iron-sulfur cluster repair protein YtfE (RIC family)